MCKCHCWIILDELNFLIKLSHDLFMQLPILFFARIKRAGTCFMPSHVLLPPLSWLHSHVFFPLFILYISFLLIHSLFTLIHSHSSLIFLISLLLFLRPDSLHRILKTHSMAHCFFFFFLFFFLFSSQIHTHLYTCIYNIYTHKYMYIFSSFLLALQVTNSRPFIRLYNIYKNHFAFSIPLYQ